MFQTADGEWFLLAAPLVAQRDAVRAERRDVDREQVFDFPPSGVSGDSYAALSS